MALWQYSFQLLPRSTEITEGDTFLNREITANLDFWHNIQTSPLDIAEIQTILPVGKSWNDDLLIFGDSEKSCISFFIEKGFILEAELRVDLRSDFPMFLQRMRDIEFMQKVFLLDESGYVLTINSSLIVSRIFRSEHYNKFKGFYSE